MTFDWDRLFIARYGDLTLDLLETDDDMSQRLARKAYPRRDGANTEDLGEEERETAATIIWHGPGHLARLKAFVELKRRGEPQTFVHPLTGQYQAQVDGFSFRAHTERRDVVSGSCTFVQADTDIAAFQIGESGSLEAGVEDVSASASELDAEIAALGQDDSTTVTAEAIATVNRWTNEADLAATRITLELGSLASRIDREVNRLQIATNPNAYPAYQAFLNLHRSMSRAAEAAIANSPVLTEHRVPTGMSLLAISQGLYGGGVAAENGFTQILRLNEIQTPAYIEAGTVLTIEKPGG